VWDKLLAGSSVQRTNADKIQWQIVRKTSPVIEYSAAITFSDVDITDAPKEAAVALLLIVRVVIRVAAIAVHALMSFS
jgi:hypothetical protein